MPATVFPAPGSATGTQFLEPLGAFDISPRGGGLFKNLLLWSQDLYQSSWSKTNITITPTASLTLTSGGTAGTASFVVASTTGVAVNQRITGTGIPTGTYVIALTSTTIFLSSRFTVTGSGSYSFYDPFGFNTATSSSNSQALGQTVSVTENTNYVFSFYAKKGTATAATYGIYNNTASTDIVSATSYYNSININFTTTATGTSGQRTITVASAAGLYVGLSVTAATGVTLGTRIIGISGTTITMSAANSGTVSGSITFSDTNWQRISVPFTTPSGCTSVIVYPLWTIASGFGTTLLTGLQLELGSTATPYQVTGNSSPAASGLVPQSIDYDKNFGNLRPYDPNILTPDFRIPITGQNLDVTTPTFSVESIYLNQDIDSDYIWNKNIPNAVVTKTLYFNNQRTIRFEVGSTIRISNPSRNYSVTATVTDCTFTSVSYTGADLPVETSGTFVESGTTLYPQRSVRTTTAPANARENLYYATIAPGLRGSKTISQARAYSGIPSSERNVMRIEKLAVPPTKIGVTTVDIKNFGKLKPFEPGIPVPDFKLLVTGQSLDPSTPTFNADTIYLDQDPSDGYIWNDIVPNPSSTKTLYFSNQKSIRFEIGSTIKISNNNSGYNFTAIVTDCTFDSVSYAGSDLLVDLSNTFVESGATLYPQRLVRTSVAPVNARENLYYATVAPGFRGDIVFNRGRTYAEATDQRTRVYSLSKFDPENQPADISLAITGQSLDPSTPTFSVDTIYLDQDPSDGYVWNDITPVAAVTKTLYFSQQKSIIFPIGSIMRIRNINTGYSANVIVTDCTFTSVSYASSDLPFETVGTFVETSSTLYPQSYVRPTTAPTNPRENLYYATIAPGLRSNSSINQGRVYSAFDYVNSSIGKEDSFYEQILVSTTTAPTSPRENLYYASIAPGLRSNSSINQGRIYSTFDSINQTLVKSQAINVLRSYNNNEIFSQIVNHSFFDVNTQPPDFLIPVTGQSLDATTPTFSIDTLYLEQGVDYYLWTENNHSATTKTLFFARQNYVPFLIGSVVRIKNINTGYSENVIVTNCTLTSVSYIGSDLPVDVSGTYVEGTLSTIYAQRFVRTTISPINPRENLFYATIAPGKQANRYWGVGPLFASDTTSSIPNIYQLEKPITKVKSGDSNLTYAKLQSITVLKSEETIFSTELLEPTKFRNNIIIDLIAPYVAKLSAASVLKADGSTIKIGKLQAANVLRGSITNFVAENLEKQIAKLFAETNPLSVDLIEPVRFSNNVVFDFPTSYSEYLEKQIAKLSNGDPSLLLPAKLNAAIVVRGDSITFATENLTKQLEKLVADQTILESDSLKIQAISVLIDARDRVPESFGNLQKQLEELLEDRTAIQIGKLRDVSPLKDTASEIFNSSTRLETFDNLGIYNENTSRIINSTNLVLDIVNYYLYDLDTLELKLITNADTLVLSYENLEYPPVNKYPPGTQVKLVDSANGNIYITQVLSSTTNSVTIPFILGFPSTALYGTISSQIGPSVYPRTEVRPTTYPANARERLYYAELIPTLYTARNYGFSPLYPVVPPESLVEADSLEKFKTDKFATIELDSDGNISIMKTGDFKRGSVGIQDPAYVKKEPIQFWN